MIEPTDDDVLCKGSWMLCTACGKYKRCMLEAAALISKLRDKLFQVMLYLPPANSKYDFSDDFKVLCFNNARAALKEGL
jgi:hypothetical protein